MTHTVTLDDRDVAYEIKRFARQRRINIHVRGGALLVTAPPRVTERGIEQAIERNKQWILTHTKEKKLLKNVTIEPSTVRYAKKALHQYVSEALMRYNSYYGFTYGRISIRSQKSRWGSCSSSGNISFNIELWCLAPDIRDYVIVHELCHIRELNHSTAFWDLVGQTIPDYKERRRTLKQYAL